ncbi:amidohydrolase family protein [Pelomyxa schiedti]|nr:amidohydrolase family protein [Pelomyxa schiedti]
MPGFNDTHVHYEPPSFVLPWTDAAGIRDRQQLSELAHTVAEESDFGTGWIVLRNVPHDVAPTSLAEIDSFLPSTRIPLVLVFQNEHCGMANTAALRCAKLLGRGFPLELRGAALDAILACVVDPPASLLRQFAKLGITSIQLMGHSSEKTAIMASMADQGRIPLRIAVALDKTSFVSGAHNSLPRSADARVRVMALKLYADHLVDGDTAWRLPYFGPSVVETWGAHTLAYDAGVGGIGGSKFSDVDTEHKDVSTKAKHAFYSVDELTTWIERAEAAGLQVCIHATGDGAVRGILDAVETVTKKKRNQLPSLCRHRIEHAELIHPEDVPRFGSIGVLASMSPLHAPSQYWNSDCGYLKHVHPGLWDTRGFVWQNLIQTNGRVPLSTDYPVVQANPLCTVHAAISRVPYIKGGPSQAFTLENALKGYTAEPAYAEFQETRKGTLTEGMLADFTLLSTDILAFRNDREQAMAALLKSVVNMTVCDGHITFLSPSIELQALVIVPPAPVPPRPRARLSNPSHPSVEFRVRNATTPADIRTIALVMAKAALCNPGLNDWNAFGCVDPAGWYIGELVKPQSTVAPSMVACIGAMVWTESYAYIGHDHCSRHHQGKGYEALMWHTGMSHILDRCNNSNACVATDIDPEEEAELHYLGFKPSYRSTRLVASLQSPRIVPEIVVLKHPTTEADTEVVANYTATLNSMAELFVEYTGVNRPDFAKAWFTQPSAFTCAYRSPTTGKLLSVGVLRPSAGGYRVGPLFVCRNTLELHTEAAAQCVLHHTIQALATFAIAPKPKPKVLIPESEPSSAAVTSVNVTSALAIDVPDTNSWAFRELTNMGFAQMWVSLRMTTTTFTGANLDCTCGLVSWEVGP